MGRVLAVALAMLVATAQAGLAQTAGALVPPGRVILLFAVKPPSGEAKRGLTSWIQAFRGSLRFLIADAIGQPGSMPALKVGVVVQDVEDADSGMLETTFGRQPTLQVLSTVATASAQSTFVNSEIYLGDLVGSLTGPFIYLSREIQPGQYKPTREALSVITLYAYAMAMARSGPRSESRIPVCRILDRANMYRSGDLDPQVLKSLDDLFQAIGRELQERECGGKG